MRGNPRLVIDAPSAERDRTAWVKVAVIAVVGFSIGVAWPRLLGVKLGPSAPGTATAAATTTATANAAPAAPPAKPAAPVAAVASTASPPPKALVVPEVHVGRAVVINCKNADNETLKGRECGKAPAGLDAIVTPRLRKLGSCGAAEGQTGKLSVVVTVDFNRGGVSHTVGKSSNVGNLDGIAGCLKTHFSGVVAQDVPHEHKRYVVAYAATFKEPKARAATAAAESPTSTKPTASPAAAMEPLPAPGDPAGGADSEKPATTGGEATVAWEVALVRDLPKTGAIVARLPRGAKVRPGASKGGWYTVQFGEGFKSQGWVYRGAIGR